MLLSNDLVTFPGHDFVDDSAIGLQVLILVSIVVMLDLPHSIVAYQGHPLLFLFILFELKLLLGLSKVELILLDELYILFLGTSCLNLLVE